MVKKYTMWCLFELGLSIPPTLQKRLGQPELQTGAIPSQCVTLIVCSAKSSRKNILVFHGW